MIKINLLPAEAGGKRMAAAKGGGKGPGGGASSSLLPAVLALLVAYGAAGYYGYSLYDRGVQAQALVDKAKADKAKKEKEIKSREAKFRSQYRELQEAREKFAVVQALNSPNRVFWSEKIDELALASRRAAVYLTSLKLTERIEEVETPDSIKRREDYEKKKAAPGGTKDPAPKVIKTPIIYQTFTVEAIAYGQSSAEQTAQISLFNRALTQLDWQRWSGKFLANGDKQTTSVKFIDGLIPEFSVGNARRDMVGGIEVLRFSFVIEAKEQKDETAMQPSQPQPAAGGKS